MSEKRTLSVNFDEGPPPPDVLEKCYSEVLDFLLIPPQVKAELIKTQTPEKKWQMVLMNANVVKLPSHGTSSSSSSRWGEKGQALLLSLRKSKVPDVRNLQQLRSILSTANREVLQSFIEASGMLVLTKCVDERLCRSFLTELDVAVIYELVLCLKAAMNNSVGE